MRQTVAILTALILSLMVVTGFVLTGSLRQSELMMQRDKMMMELRREHSDLTLENLRLTRELETTRTERDALTIQLNDAVLASRESLQTALEQANRELERLQANPPR